MIGKHLAKLVEAAKQKAASTPLDDAALERETRTAADDLEARGLGGTEPTEVVVIGESFIPNLEGEVSVRVLIDPSSMKAEQRGSIDLEEFLVNEVRLSQAKLTSLVATPKKAGASKKIEVELRGRAPSGVRSLLQARPLSVRARIPNGPALRGFKVSGE